MACMRPPNAFRLMLAYAGVLDMIGSVQVLIRDAGGTLSDGEKDYIPQSEWAKAIFAARSHVAIYVATLAVALAAGSFIPLLLLAGHGFTTPGTC